MFLIVTRDYKFALALATTVFFTIKIKLFKSRSLFYNLAKINVFWLFKKYLNIVNLARTFTRLYASKINCKCLKWAVYFDINSYWYWKTYLNWLKMLLVKAQLSLGFFKKNPWISLILLSF